jgi:uncharacterized protein
MDGHKHIEMTVAKFIAGHYKNPVEVGVGSNWTAAALLASWGLPVTCTDVRPQNPPEGVCFHIDDVWVPDLLLYSGADVIFSIRPGPEMVPAMLLVAGAVNVDLIVYHLGFETFGDGGEIIDCGVLLHRYFRRQNSKSDD